jgi:oxygen-independent coproporphyrinogen-3 oxidase
MLDWMESHSIYIHIPFCIHRCFYCDFNTYADRLSDIPTYVNGLCREITLISSCVADPVPIRTIYFGGGTPSLLSIEQIDQILNIVKNGFEVTHLEEITIEANPGTVNKKYLTGLLKLGINRLSLGAQSALPHELKLLGRIHTVDQIRQAYQDARRAGFKNINLDFMYGLPGQTCDDWQASLNLAVELRPEHLSCYALTLEESTPLARMISEGVLPMPDDDQAADCYEMVMDQLGGAGYGQYEISNWAMLQDDTLLSCRHNLQYWHNDPYLGFGAGAHGYSNCMRVANVIGIDDYLTSINSEKAELFPFSPANETRLVIDEVARLQEAMMVGLRLTKEGIARSHYLHKYHVDFYDNYGQQIDHLVKNSLLEWVDGVKEILRLTRKGRLLGNQVFMQFVGEESD